MATKTTFKEIWCSSAPEASAVDVVFVHGLNGPHPKTKPLRKRLRAWLHAKRPRCIHRLSWFGFNAPYLLREGNEIFRSISGSLLQGLAKLKGLQEIIFIAHGIAGWVIKDSIASNGDIASQMLCRTTAIIFLGLPEVAQKSEWIHYRKLLLDSVLRDTKKETETDDTTNPVKYMPFSRNSKRGNPLEFEPLQLIGENFKQVMGSPYAPRLHYLNPLPRESKLPHRQSNQSNSTSSSKELTPKQLVDLSLFDIKANDKTDTEIMRLISGYVTPPQSVIRESETTRPDLQHTGPVRQVMSKPALDQMDHVLAPPPDSITRGETQSGSRKESIGQNVGTTPLPYSSSDKTDDIQKDSELRPRSRISATPAKRVADFSDNMVLARNEYSRAERKQENRNEEEVSKLARKYYQSGELRKAKNLYSECKVMIGASKLPPDDQTKRIAKVDVRIAQLYVEEGLYKKAEDEFIRLEKSAEAKLGKEHVRVLEIRLWLGITHDKQGQYKKAKTELTSIQASMNTSPRDTGPEDNFNANALMTKNALSLVFGHTGEFAKAIATSKEALDYVENNPRLKLKAIPIKLNRAAICTFHENYKEATDFNDAALKSMEEHLGPKHIKTLDCWSLRAYLLVLDGKADQAEEYCQMTLRRMRAELGKDHPSTLQAMRTLVMIYKAQARFTDALHTAQLLVGSSRSNPALGRYHPQTISAESALAAVYAAKGELKNALEIQDHVVSVSEDIRGDLGSDHPTTLMHRSDLAAIYCMMGEWSIAREETCEIFAKQCENFKRECLKENQGQKTITPAASDTALRQMREDNLRSQLEWLRSMERIAVPPSLLSTMHCLGVCERDREGGDIDLAGEILGQVADYRKTTLTWEHPDTLSSLFEIGRTKKLRGDLEGAIEVFEQVLTTRTALMGNDHPDTLAASHKVYLIRCRLGDYEDSQWKLQAILDRRKELLGESHPDVIRSQIELGEQYYEMGRPEEAEELQLAALKTQLYNTESEPPNRRTAANWSVLYEKAFQALPLPALKPKLTKNDMIAVEVTPGLKYYPDVVSPLASLASIYSDYGDAERLNNAVKIQTQIVEIQKICLGEAAITTLRSTNDLALMLQTRGNGKDLSDDFEKAIGLYETISRFNPSNNELRYTARSNLASLYFAKDNFVEAEKIQTEVLATQLKCDGDALAVAESRFNLALTKRELYRRREAQGQQRKEILALLRKEALELLQRAVNEMKGTPGENDPKISDMSRVLDEWRVEEELYYEGATTADRFTRRLDPSRVDESTEVQPKRRSWA